MYDDYDLDYSYINDYNLDEDAYTSNLDEDMYTTNLDEDYTRDGQDYQELAYHHYA
jgi:hypothetical protein